MIGKCALLVCCLFILCHPGSVRGEAKTIPDEFMEIRAVLPDVLMDIRYYTPHNFVGTRVDGYRAPKCYLTRPAAAALARVQGELVASGLTLKIYDCYRPQKAVNHFVRWAAALGDTATKAEFYPKVDKKNLFRDGYIAEKSGHSRGSTIDLTIVVLPALPQENYMPHKNLRACYLPRERRYRDNGIDMGTGFDCFDARSHTLNKTIGPSPRLHRALLKTVMEKHGFINYDKEWWHYTLKGEPFPDTYFDFDVE
ncbi:MAG: M15 family metallopeptidase [Syntrophales bacterium]